MLNLQPNSKADIRANACGGVFWLSTTPFTSVIYVSAHIHIYVFLYFSRAMMLNLQPNRKLISEPTRAEEFFDWAQRLSSLSYMCVCTYTYIRFSVFVPRAMMLNLQPNRKLISEQMRAEEFLTEHAIPCISIIKMHVPINMYTFFSLLPCNDVESTTKSKADIRAKMCGGVYCWARHAFHLYYVYAYPHIHIDI